MGYGGSRNPYHRLQCIFFYLKVDKGYLKKAIPLYRLGKVVKLQLKFFRYGIGVSNDCLELMPGVADNSETCPVEGMRKICDGW